MANLEKMAPDNENPSLSQGFSGTGSETGSELGGIPESGTIEPGVVINADEALFPEDTVIKEWSRSADEEERRAAQALSSAQPGRGGISQLDLETECLLLMDQSGKIELTPQQVTEMLIKLKH